MEQLFLLLICTDKIKLLNDYLLHTVCNSVAQKCKTWGRDGFQVHVLFLVHRPIDPVFGMKGFLQPSIL